MARLVPMRGQLLAPALIYLIGCLASVLAALVVEDAWLLMLYASGGAAALLTWHCMRWPDEWARYFSFGAVLLLMCLINRLFYVADYLIAGARFDEWPFIVIEPEVAVFKGEVISLLGTLITVFAWASVGGGRVSPSVILHRSNARYRLLLIVYLMSLGGLVFFAVDAVDRRNAGSVTANAPIIRDCERLAAADDQI